MKRASYRHAVEWIALNDEPEGSLEEMTDLVSVVLIADVFGIEAARVARDVMAYRGKNAKEKS